MRTRLTMLFGGLAALLLSGCLTYHEISRNNALREWEKPREAFRAAKQEAGKRLRSDFEVVFGEAGYLSVSNTPQRAALSDLFRYGGGEIPTAPQFARLVDAVKRNQELAEPLKAMWMSPQATVDQRMDFAVMVDRGNLQCSDEILKWVLSRHRLTDDEFQVLAKRVRADGPTGKYIQKTLENRREFRERVEKQSQEQRRQWEKKEMEQRKRKEEQSRKENELRVRYQTFNQNRQDFAQKLLQGLRQPPEEFMKVVECADKFYGVEAFSEFNAHIREYSTTNKLLLVDHLLASGKRTGTYNFALLAELVRRGLNKFELRRRRQEFIDALSNDQLDTSSPGWINGENYVCQFALELAWSGMMEEEELVLAYRQPWMVPVLKRCFHYQYLPFEMPSEERALGLQLKSELRKFENPKYGVFHSRRDYQARVLELVREMGPQNIPIEWFKEFTRREGEDTRQWNAYLERMKPYTQVPVAEAVKTAAEKLREKQGRLRAERQAYDESCELAGLLHASSEAFRRKVLPRLDDPTIRRALLEDIRQDRNTIPADNLWAVVEWELRNGPNKERELYPVLKRAELTGEMLGKCYPELVDGCAKAHAFQSVWGLLANPNVPKALADSAYREPRLSELRLEYLRRSYGKREMEVDTAMAVECELAKFEPPPHDNRRLAEKARETITSEQYPARLDAILKKYLPATRPPEWKWECGNPEFNYFTKDR